MGTEYTVSRAPYMLDCMTPTAMTWIDTPTPNYKWRVMGNEGVREYAIIGGRDLFDFYINP
jgi:hypothetical protein